MKANIYLCVLVAGLFSCQPELQPLGTGTAAPIACHFTGELDGQLVQFEAGVAQHFLHTTLQNNALQLFETSASIKPDPCNGCGNHLEITIRDFQINNGNEPMNPDSTFQIKTYPFQLGETGASLRQITLRQRNLDGLAPIQNQWSVFNLSSSLIAQSNQSEANFTLPEGNYSTRLVSTFADGCRDTSTTLIQLDSTLNSGLTCQADIQVSRILFSTSLFLDTVDVQVPNPTSVVWLIGGMTFTGGSLFLMPDSIGLGDVFEVTLQIASATCTAKVVQRIAKNPALRCATSFRVSNVQSVDPLQAGHVRVKWTDAQGQVFGSEMDQQPNWANFEVTAIDTFANNRSGLPTLLLTGRINSRLFQSGSSLFKDLRNAEFKMAFPYKP